MSVKWYYSNGDNVFGPVSAAEMRKAAADGNVNAKTVVRRGESGPWVAASRVKGLLNKERTPADSLGLPETSFSPVSSENADDAEEIIEVVEIDEAEPIESDVATDHADITEDDSTWENFNPGDFDTRFSEDELSPQEFVYPRKITPKPKTVKHKKRKKMSRSSEPSDVVPWGAKFSCIVAVSLAGIFTIFAFSGLTKAIGESLILMDKERVVIKKIEEEEESMPGSLQLSGGSYAYKELKSDQSKLELAFVTNRVKMFTSFQQLMLGWTCIAGLKAVQAYLNQIE